jgi:hypothetical protein
LIGPSPAKKTKQNKKQKKLWRLPKIEVSIGKWEWVPFGSKHYGRKVWNHGS